MTMPMPSGGTARRSGRASRPRESVLDLFFAALERTSSVLLLSLGLHKGEGRRKKNAPAHTAINGVTDGNETEDRPRLKVSMKKMEGRDISSKLNYC